MIVLACILLVLSGLLLMVSQGVGPFAREPWEAQYFRFRKLPQAIRITLITCATLVAIACTLVVVGIIPVEATA